MRLPRLIGLSFALVACRGVSVRPEEADASTLKTVQLSAEEQREVASLADRAVESIVRRHYSDAETQARVALDLDPRCARARSVLGMVTFQRAAIVEPPDLFGVNEGERQILLALQLAPDDAFVGWIHAVFLDETGHTSAAADAAEAALARTGAAPPNERAPLLGVAGKYRYELGEERRALPLLQQYVTLRPDDAAACFRIGNCLLRIASAPIGPKPGSLEVAQVQCENAARAFARCLALAPGDEDAALAIVAATVRAADLAEERGLHDVAVQRLDDAEKQCRDIANRFTESAEPLFRIGIIAEKRAQFDRAGEAWSQALLRDPQHLGSLMNLAALGERATIVGAPAARELLVRALRVDDEHGGLTADERRRIEKHLASSNDAK